MGNSAMQRVILEVPEEHYEELMARVEGIPDVTLITRMITSEERAQVQEKLAGYKNVLDALREVSDDRSREAQRDLGYIGILEYLNNYYAGAIDLRGRIFLPLNKEKMEWLRWYVHEALSSCCSRPYEISIRQDGSVYPLWRNRQQYAPVITPLQGQSIIMHYGILDGNAVSDREIADTLGEQPKIIKDALRRGLTSMGELLLRRSDFRTILQPYEEIPEAPPLVVLHGGLSDPSQDEKE